MADDGVQGKNEISRAALLPHFAINASLHQDSGPRVDFIGNHRANRAEGIKPLGPSPLAVFFLQVTGGDIVDAGIAKYVRTDILIRTDFVAGPCYHDTEFTLVIHALRDFRATNLSPGWQQSRWWF